MTGARAGSGWESVLGMNARTLYVERDNPPQAIRLVNNKRDTKAALVAAGVPVVPTLAAVEDRVGLRGFDWRALPDAWALKPNYGRQGAGILLAGGRDGGEGWRTLSGRRLSARDVEDHVSYILEGEYSGESVERDSALFEPLILPEPGLGQLAPEGLPDIRVVCFRSEPVLAMLRLPTRASEGRANLHQGAIGAGIELESGRIFRAVLGREEIDEHPDTGRTITGLRVPYWDAILSAARACGGPRGWATWAWTR